MRRVLRFAARAAVAALPLVVLSTLLLAFPEPLFAHRTEEGAFVVHSQKAIPRASLAASLREAERRLERSEIHRTASKHRVFITGSKRLYWLLNGPYYPAIARNVELTNAILLPHLNVGAALVLHFDGRSAHGSPRSSHTRRRTRWCSTASA